MIDEKENKARYVDVALPLPVDKFFTYRVPYGAFDGLAAGCRVRVRFGKRMMTGYVASFRGKPEGKFQVRDISEALDERPLLGRDLFDLARWMAGYYIHPLGEILKVMLPPGVKGKQRKIVERGGDWSFPLDAKSPELDPQQKAVFGEVSKSLRAGEYMNALLHGVTGSGKTEVYLRCIEEALKIGKSAIVLVPEIALIPQATARFFRRFESKVAILHSRLTGAQRHGILKMASEGDLKVIIGPRSAVFAPIRDLGIIVIDEEQDPSFKQQEKPHYNAVDVADKRAKDSGAVLLMGSATPSLSRYKIARESKSAYFRLESRHSAAGMPPVEIIDMRKEKGLFSTNLLDHLEGCRSRGEQGIVLINRRGHANFVQCRKCGWIERCPNCSISLTYHSRGSSQICHYCGYRKDPPGRCGGCGAYSLSRTGAGTQKVEMELLNLIPGIRIARMDFDTTSGRNGHMAVLERFGRGDADVLLGTQMVAKGHHFPDVTVVGILSADYGLNFPDYMASERTFQLLFQAAGRTGRGEKEGRVIVQTYAPEHYIFQYLTGHDFDGFAETELSLRRQLRYPPESGLILFTLSSRNYEKASEAADSLCGSLKKTAEGMDASCLGPAPAQIGRLRGKYRFQAMVKGEIDHSAKKALVLSAIGSVAERRGVELKWDVDPVNFF